MASALIVFAPNGDTSLSSPQLVENFSDAVGIYVFGINVKQSYVVIDSESDSLVRLLLRVYISSHLHPL